jgi:hypothetical protein
MTRPGALESKKRRHDLIHRDSDKMVFQEKSTHFPEDPLLIGKILLNQEDLTSIT